MKIQDHLDVLFKTSQRIKINKAIIIGDLHLGVRDNADDFDGHDMLFINSIPSYLRRGYDLLLGGDIIDEWENPNRKKVIDAYSDVWKIISENADRQIQGNHDPDSGPIAHVLVLESGKEILWTHGHIGDFFNYQASWLGRFFVRHIWRNLQLTGVFKDPTTATTRNPEKHEATRLAFFDWAKTRKKEVIFHHTHFATKGPSWNAGSWVGIGGQTILIDGDKIEVKYFI